MDLKTVRRYLGTRCIGPDELRDHAPSLGLSAEVFPVSAAERVALPERLLEEQSNDLLLVYGLRSMAQGRPLTLVHLREHFGADSDAHEPCFYAQDWYLREDFARSTVLESTWYLIHTDLRSSTRGIAPERLSEHLQTTESLPLALLIAYAFFCNYFVSRGELLWKDDYVWCRDTDHQGDRIYVGRYVDPGGINRNGFSVHRHLSIRPWYGVSPEVRLLNQ